VLSRPHPRISRATWPEVPFPPYRWTEDLPHRSVTLWTSKGIMRHFIAQPFQVRKHKYFERMPGQTRAARSDSGIPPSPRGSWGGDSTFAAG